MLDFNKIRKPCSFILLTYDFLTANQAICNTRTEI